MNIDIWRPPVPVLAATKVHIGMHAVGDEHFAAIEHPTVALATAPRRARLTTSEPAPGLGLMPTALIDFARDHGSRHVLGLLRGRAGMVQMRTGHVGVHQHAHDEARRMSTATSASANTKLVKASASAPPYLALVHQPEKAGLAHTLCDTRAARLPASSHAIAAGLDFALDKALPLWSRRGLVFRQVVDVVHGAAHVIKKSTGAWGTRRDAEVTVSGLHAENTRTRVFNRCIQCGG